MLRSTGIKTFFIVFVVLLSSLAAGAQNLIAGDWQGSFVANDTSLRLVLHIKSTAEGILSATLDSVNQDSPNIPVSSVSFGTSDLKLDVAQVQGSFEGKLSKGGDEIKGHWTEGGQTFAVTFRRVTDPTQIVPPTPIGGNWKGTLIVHGKPYEIILHLDTEHYAKLTASLDGVDGLSPGALASQVSFTDNALRFSIDAVHVTFFGASTDDGSEIDGVWTQGPSFPLVLRRFPADAEPPTTPTKAAADDTCRGTQSCT